MTRWMRGLGLAAGLAMTVSGAWSAAAAVTPADVWTDMQDLARIRGESVTVGKRSTTDGTLTLENVRLRLARGPAVIEARLDRIRLVQNADGSVAVTLPRDYPIAFESRMSDGKPLQLDLTASGRDLTIEAAGEPGRIAYQMKASGIGLLLDRAKLDGKPLDMTARVDATGMSANYRTVAGTPYEMKSSYSLDNLTVTAEGRGLGGADKTTISGAMGPISSAADLKLPRKDGQKGLVHALDAGLVVDARTDLGRMTFAVTQSGSKGRREISGRAEDANFTVNLDRRRMSYGIEQKGLKLRLTAPNLKIKSIDVGMSDLALKLNAPFAPSEQARPFGLTLKLVDLAASPDVWSVLDPKTALRHDPATFILDLSGMARVLRSVAATAARPGGGVPAALESLTLNQLEIGALGADLTGKGAVTFDNSDPARPKPDGSVDLRLTGANTLIDALTKIGLLPRDQATGARMMLAIFTRPGPGKDELLSTIHFAPDGAITANGQRIR